LPHRNAADLMIQYSQTKIFDFHNALGISAAYHRRRFDNIIAYCHHWRKSPRVQKNNSKSKLGVVFLINS